MSEIRPCPFCGREPESGAQNGCVRCPAHVGWTPVAEWNTRPAEDALRTERDEFRNGAAAQFARAFAADLQVERLRALITEYAESDADVKRAIAAQDDDAHVAAHNRSEAAHVAVIAAATKEKE